MDREADQSPSPARQTARTKFTLGQRVTLSAHGLNAGLGRRRTQHTGTVVSFGRGATSVVVGVKPDGVKRGYAFHMAYWDPISPVSPATPTTPTTPTTPDEAT